MWWPLKGPSLVGQKLVCCLSSESVQGASLPLEGVDHIHGGDGLPLGVLGVGDGIPDDVLKEDLEDSTGLLVDEAGDPLDSSPPRQTADCGLGDALDVVPQHLTVTLGASLAQSLASLAASSHLAGLSVADVETWPCPVYMQTSSQSQRTKHPTDFTFFVTSAPKLSGGASAGRVPLSAGYIGGVVLAVGISIN